ncbi:hypothetical protein BJ165DRAFT_1614556 [Panaeolus papilionaceus]|nr:hypothetical protein BJ165DRAFT_1614556 [Panaeolus papilionaceus]
MPSVNQFSAWIEIDNERVTEYQKRLEIDHGEKTAHCWIASEAEKYFEICIHHKDRSFDVGYSIMLDGKEMPCGGTILWYPNSSKVAPYPSIKIRGCSLGRGWLQPFMFSDCILMDESEDDYTSYINTFHRIGEIRIVVWRVLWQEAKGRGDASDLERRELTQPLRLSEKAFKMAEHCSRLGPPQLERTGKPFEHNLADEPDKVFLERKRVNLISFVFKYRSLERLRADRIAPMPTVVHPVPEIIDLTGLSDSEDEDERARSMTLTSLQQELTMLKAEASDLKRRLFR